MTTLVAVLTPFLHHSSETVGGKEEASVAGTPIECITYQSLCFLDGFANQDQGQGQDMIKKSLRFMRMDGMMKEQCNVSMLVLLMNY